MAKESIHDDRPLRETFNESEFLTEFRDLAASATRGCIILERPDLLEDLAERHGAKDTTARAKSFIELNEMTSHPSQYDPGHEIPEKSWAYRIAKRFWFNDYGAYGKHFRDDQWRKPNGKKATPAETASSST